MSASFLDEKQADATSRAAQAAGSSAAVGSGCDRRVDRDVPARAGRPGAGPDRPDRAASKAATRPHGRLPAAGAGAVCGCRLPGGAAAAGGGAAAAARRRRTALASRLPVKSALVQARARLGPEPLRALFAQAARPLATADTQGAWYRDWGRSMGPRWTWADTRANDAALARRKAPPGGHRRLPAGAGGRAGGVRTHATVGAVLGSYGTGRGHAGRSAAGRAGGGAWRGCCCWPTGCLGRGAVADRRRHRRGAAVARQDWQDCPQAARRSGPCGRPVAVAAVRRRRPAQTPPDRGAGAGVSPG